MEDIQELCEDIENDIFNFIQNLQEMSEIKSVDLKELLDKIDELSLYDFDSQNRKIHRIKKNWELGAHKICEAFPNNRLYKHNAETISKKLSKIIDQLHMAQSLNFEEKSYKDIYDRIDGLITDFLINFSSNKYKKTITETEIIKKLHIIENLLEQLETCSITAQVIEFESLQKLFLAFCEEYKKQEKNNDFILLQFDIIAEMFSYILSLQKPDTCSEENNENDMDTASLFNGTKRGIEMSIKKLQANDELNLLDLKTILYNILALSKRNNISAWNKKIARFERKWKLLFEKAKKRHTNLIINECLEITNKKLEELTSKTDINIQACFEEPDTTFLTDTYKEIDLIINEYLIYFDNNDGKIKESDIEIINKSIEKLTGLETNLEKLETYIIDEISTNLDSRQDDWTFFCNEYKKLENKDDFIVLQLDIVSEIFKTVLSEQDGTPSQGEIDKIVKEIIQISPKILELKLNCEPVIYEMYSDQQNKARAHKLLKNIDGIYYINIGTNKKCYDKNKHIIPGSRKDNLDLIYQKAHEAMEAYNIYDNIELSNDKLLQLLTEVTMCKSAEDLAKGVEKNITTVINKCKTWINRMQQKTCEGIFNYLTTITIRLEENLEYLNEKQINNLFITWKNLAKDLS